MSSSYRNRGCVVDAAGLPIVGAYVTIAKSTVLLPEIAVVSGPDGGFELRLPEGNFTLRAQAGQLVGSASFNSADEQDVRIVVDG